MGLFPGGAGGRLEAANCRSACADHQARSGSWRAIGVRDRTRRGSRSLSDRASRSIPGASAAAYVAISVLQKCFAEELSGGWLPRLKKIIPSYGISLIDDVETCNRVRAETAAALKIEYL